MSGQFTPLHRPVAEAEGDRNLKTLFKRIEIVGYCLTVVGLFVSVNGIETVVGLTGMGLSALARSKRFVRWVGEATLKAPKPRPRRFFND